MLFILGFIAGGILGMAIMALMAAAKQEDESFVLRKEDSTSDCFWCGEKIQKTNNEYICPACGWIYKGEER
jgi:Zn finger protein HypA/HybF involved in hydrogenase expression